MTNLHGAGKNGKRLWMLSSDRRWIEIPYGSGQDPKIRSVNIWNDKKKKWMTPTWGWTLRHRTNASFPDMDAFDVYLPGRSWVGANTAGGLNPYYNPTFISRRSTNRFSPLANGYQRFFYLQERVDPNWRIVPVASPLPIQVPNVTTMFANATYSQDDEVMFFWPSGALHQYTHYVNNSDTVPVQDITTIREIGQFEHPTFLTQTNSYAADPAYLRTSRILAGDEFLATTIDLKAIRQRLRDKYDQQGTDFVGQYAPIDTMKIRRIYIIADIGISHELVGENPPASTLSSIDYRIYAKVGDTALNSGSYSGYFPGDGTYTVRNPAGFVPNGTLIYERNGLSLIQQGVVREPDDDTNHPVRYRRYSYLGDTITLTFDDPGDDNITFYSTITGNPSLSMPAIDSWNVGVYMTTNRITIHYATDGHDTPVELHTPLALA